MVAEGRADGTNVLLVEPMSFMNRSGGPIVRLMDYYRIPARQLVVVHDEIDLDFDSLRLKHGGGDNGHNGLRSIRGVLGNGDYYRVRVGVGRPPGRQDPVDYLLRPFPRDRRSQLPLVVARAADSVEYLLHHDLSSAQNMFNG